MINFCLTNDLSLSTRKYPKYIDLPNGFTIGYEEDVETYETHGEIILFCGILWQDDINQFTNLHNLVPNGQFYAIRYDKYKQQVTVITDFIETFAVYYFVEDNKVIVTNKLISFSNKFFTINDKWVKTAIDGVYVDRKVISYEKIPNWKGENGYPSDVWYSGITPINKVKMIGPGAFFTLDLATYKTSHTLYYDPRRDYVDIALETKNKLSFDEITTFSDIIQNDNVDKIYEKYGDRLVTTISNGIDSLHLASMLGERIKNIPVVGYTGDWFEDEPADKLLELYKNFPKGITHILNKQEYDNLYTPSITEDHCDIPCMNPALMAEIVLLKDQYKDKVYVKGTFGDEIYWHNGTSGLLCAIHEFNCTTLEQAQKVLQNHYTNLPVTYSQKLFDYFANMSFTDALVSYHYYRQKAYIRDELQIYNQLIVSPYIDLRLRKLMPMADHNARLRNMLDVESQKKQTSKKYLKYCNKHKGGMEESHFHIDRKKVTRHVLKLFLKKWNES